MPPLAERRDPPWLVFAGPTAAGKTEIAHRYSDALTGRGIPHVLINLDRVQMIRHADIGSAKPSKAERAHYPYRLLDFLEPPEQFSAADFISALVRLRAESAPDTRWIFIGGSHFYLRVLLTGMWDAPATTPEQHERLEQWSTEALHTFVALKDPLSAQRIGGQDRYRLIRAAAILERSSSPLGELKTRVPFPETYFHVMWLDRDPEALRKRIALRSRVLLDQGWIEEVRQFLGLFPTSDALQTVGYRQIVDYLQGKHPDGRILAPGLRGLEEEITLATQQLARKQRQFIRRLAATVPSQRAHVDSYFLDQSESVDALWKMLNDFG